MRFPCVTINLKKIEHNAEKLVKWCSERQIEVMAVTKGICGLDKVVRTFIKGGAKKLGDSRIENIVSLKQAGISIPIYLLRIPMLSEVEDVVRWADGSLNSEVKAIEALSAAAKTLGKKHKVILMVEAGDLREGVMPENVLDTVSEIIKLSNIEFEGIGTNLGCYGGVKASYDNMKLLVDLATDIEQTFGIEVKTKPSYPIGEIGLDAFGNKPVFEDKGLMRRAIVALGKQDCRIEGLTPVDKSIDILGASSDHLLLDVTKNNDIKVGSIVEFNLSYGALLGLMTSKYVKKYII